LREARQYHFASVCVNPYWVPLVRAELAGSAVKICTVVGFPLGATSTESKVAEAGIALRDGAQEIDMVINVGALRSGDNEAVKSDIRQVVKVTHEAKAIVKVILETALLDDNQKAIACTLAKLAGADFVKTSTGFRPVGRHRARCGAHAQRGGARDGHQGRRWHSHPGGSPGHDRRGATRIGASASVKIVEPRPPERRVMHSPAKPPSGSAKGPSCWTPAGGLGGHHANAGSGPPARERR